MLLSVVLFGTASVLGLLCAKHRRNRLLLSFLLVCLVCAGIVAALLAELPLDVAAMGPSAVILCLLIPGRGGDGT